ncbi:MAG: hypothetical protein ACRYFA_09380, partial [Janthinobacterium lividum]
MTVNRLFQFITWSILLAMTFVNVPTIAAIPFNQTVTILEGSFAVLNAGSNATAFQWYFNGRAIAGATSKNYTAGQAGIYKVVAFNSEACASEASDEITVVVQATSTTTTVTPSLTAATCSATGTILLERWDNVSGSSISNIPLTTKA